MNRKRLLVLLGMLLATCIASTNARAQFSQTFYNTGASQTFNVPAGVTSVNFTVMGASGASANYRGGNGAAVSGTLSVTPNQPLYIFVGGQGARLYYNTGIYPGYNGGGAASPNSYNSGGGGGGGASDIRVGGMGLANRVVVAGGGGGGGLNGIGGDAGSFGPAGADGVNFNYGNGEVPGTGGSSAPGTGGSYNGSYGSSGTLGNGGDAEPTYGYGGGGGGGYYGGGGSVMSGGGGGSSFYDNNFVSGASIYGVYSIGDGTVQLQYSLPASFTQQPTGTSACAGTPYTLTATFSDYNTTFQWYFNGAPYYGPTYNSYGNGLSSNLNLILNTASAGNYYVAATNSSGTTNSNTVSVALASASVATSPAATTPICAGGTATITGSANGAVTAYQWQVQVNPVTGFSNLVDNAIYTGSATSTLQFNNAYSFMDGYQYQLVMTGLCGTQATTAPTTLAVTTAPAAPTFVLHPAAVVAGQTNVLYSVNSVPNTTYTWSYPGTSAILTATGASASINFLTPYSAALGTVSVTANSGCGTSAAAQQNVTISPNLVWTGSTSSDWTDASNWSANTVPAPSINVLIPATTNTPSIPASASQQISNLSLQPGAKITIGNGSKLMVTGTTVILQGNVDGAGSLSLSGLSAQSVTAADTINSLELNNAAGAIVGGNLSIKNSYLPTLGTLTNNGTFTLLSDANGTAYVGTGALTGGYINGTVNVQQYIPGGRRAYRFLGHPFSTNIPISQLSSAFDITGAGGATNGFVTTGTNSSSAFWYNTVTASGNAVNDATGWVPYSSMTDTGMNQWNPYEGLRIMVRGLPGEGLLGQAYTPSATTINMHGTLTQGDQTIALATNANQGYNFVANPYAAPINLRTLSTDTNVGPNFWVWDPHQGTQGGYIAQKLSIAYILPANSSFLLTATATSQNTVTFHESSKSTATPGALFKTTGSMGSNMVQLHIYSNAGTTSWDRLQVYFDDNGSADRDGLDAAKWMNTDLSFYTWTADNQTQSIDVRPYVNGQVIKLGLNATNQQDYTMNVDDLDVPQGVQISLHDKYLNTVKQLNQGDVYSFTVSSDANSQGDNRFELNLAGAPTAVANVTAASNLSVDIAPNPAAEAATLTYTAPVAGITTLSIVNMLGEKMYHEELGTQKAGSVAIPVNKLAAGTYLITLKCGDETVTKRLVKQ